MHRDLPPKNEAGMSSNKRSGLVEVYQALAAGFDPSRALHRKAAR